MTRSRILTIFSAVTVFLLCVMLPACLSAEEIADDDFGYYLDVPEDYKVESYTADGMTYLFKHKWLPVELIIKNYGTDVYPDSKTCLSATLNKLKATIEGIDTFKWRNADCAITIFDSKIMKNVPVTGWALSVNLPGKNDILTLLCYADSDKANDLEQFIISTLNSLCIDNGSFTSPGIITTYAFPKTQDRQVNLNIAGKRITTTFDADDAEASEFVIQCEYAVLKIFATKEKWNEAWTRFYKLIYRDNYSRLRKAASDIEGALLPQARKANPSNPSEEMNRMLLNWVQEFPYSRAMEAEATDFTNPIAAITGSGSDCDSRSLLMCILLKHMGIKTCLFVSKIYKHALYGADISPAWGARIKVKKTDYLLGETTVKNLKPGLIAQEQSDTKKWIPMDVCK